LTVDDAVAFVDSTFDVEVTA
jgi:hypothetical protein